MDVLHNASKRTLKNMVHTYIPSAKTSNTHKVVLELSRCNFFLKMIVFKMERLSLERMKLGPKDCMIFISIFHVLLKAMYVQ